ncbi:MAG: hypothetical protein PHO35_00065 [Candidatus Cloacimonetes bacterium]|jgi:hypothetical protein|nr:hypothetical protein [Candidatus Cloacimonadota bacterium]MDD4805166.1 hypothetical protein [Candidatus Cloacimonadota bacterium]
MKHCLIFFFAMICFSSLSAENISLIDVPWDDGKALELHWDLPFMPDSVSLSISDPEGNLIPTQIELGQTGRLQISDLNPDFEYSATLTAYKDEQPLSYQTTGQAREQWFYLHKSAFLILLLLICIAIIYYITAAKRGKDFFIRRISGLDSMEEAIGRATEKGKPILFVPGIGDLDDIQTIASLTILSHLAQRSAEYNTELIVPCRFSMVLSAAREVVKEAYMKVGRLDAYKPDSVFYLTDDQFGYVAGIDGIMLREQPAANFFLGSFYAESLILAETGHSTGAIQTAGTAQAHQLPFFVVSCDYTLIGEELFAASAYLSRDPQQLGSLKGHDFGKLLVILLIIAGVILEIAGISNLKDFIAGALS